MRTAAPFVVALVSVWMIAAAVIGLRQALDYRSTTRAIAVSALAWLIALGLVALVSAMFAESVAFMTRVLLGVLAVAIGVGAAAAIVGAARWNRTTAAAIERIERRRQRPQSTRRGRRAAAPVSRYLRKSSRWSADDSMRPSRRSRPSSSSTAPGVRCGRRSISGRLLRRSSGMRGSPWRR